MCTLYRLASNTAEIARLFQADPRTAWQSPASFYPGQLAPVTGHSAQGRVLAGARWGIPPPATATRPVVNIRNLDSPFWKGALTRPSLRCLVPADSFCEWADSPDPATGRKRQHFFALASGEPFAFAGLIRPGSDGEPPGFAFLTCKPNAVVAPIHSKAMPVVLGPTQWSAWLEGAPAQAFQYPLPDDSLVLLA